jgi:hypothetical protein
MSIAAKIFNRLLLSRIQLVINPLLCPEQNGFQKGRSTIQHVLALQHIIKEAKAYNLELHMVFVDFQKAFDSVSQSLLPTILAAYR